MEVYNLKFSCDENTDFKIADINSLYPFVSMTQNFPVGKPKILIGDSIQK